MTEAERIFELLKNVSVYPGKKWTREDALSAAPLVSEINRLKKEKNALVLAHSYVPPEVVFTVADFSGDSYALADYAKKTENKNIIFAGVWFMAETAKILNPSKNILIPAGHAGCTLADSLAAEELKNFQKLHPSAKTVCYINSSAEVKAACDVCVTSSNVYDIVADIDAEEIIFVPDTYMAENVRAEMRRRGVNKTIYALGGSCCVHDQYMPFHVAELRAMAPDMKVLAHPECHIDVCKMADFVGSTSAMEAYVKNSPAQNFGLLTEYGLVNRLEANYPDKHFFWNFGKCAFMKRNTLMSVLQSLSMPTDAQKVFVPEDVAAKAEKCINKMFEMVKK